MSRSGARLGTSTSRAGSLRLGVAAEGFTSQLGTGESRLANIVLGGSAITGPTAGSIFPPPPLGTAQIFTPFISPGLEVRVTQLPIEVAYTPLTTVRVTQVVIEVAVPLLVPPRLGPAQLFAPLLAGEEPRPPLLGPAVLFAPEVFNVAASGPHSTPDLSRQDRWNWPRWYEPPSQENWTQELAQSVLPGILGPAQLFTPTIEQPVLPGLLGGAQLFDPLIGPPGVLPGVLGPAQLFAPSLVFDQFVFPGLLGGAVIYAPLLTIFTPLPPQGDLGGAIQDRLAARTHIWYQDGSGQSPFTPPALFIGPDPLGGAQLFAPRIDQQVLPGVLGPAVLFAPSIGVVIGAMDLLGGGQIFAPTITLAVAPGVLGPAVLFAPTIVSAQTVAPSKLGPATLFSPSIGGFVGTGSFTADAWIEELVRHQHNRFTEHEGADTDLAHVLYATIDAYYQQGFPLEEMLRELDRRISLLEDQGAQYRRVFKSFTADAVLKQNTGGSFTADAFIVTAYAGDFSIGPMPKLGPATIITLQPQFPMLGGAVLRTPTSIRHFGVFSPALLGGAILRTPTIARFGIDAPARLGTAVLQTPTVKNSKVVTPTRLGPAVVRPPTITQ